jgi:hypothetical protein
MKNSSKGIIAVAVALFLVAITATASTATIVANGSGHTAYDSIWINVTAGGSYYSYYEYTTIGAREAEVTLNGAGVSLDDHITSGGHSSNGGATFPSTGQAFGTVWADGSSPGNTAFASLSVTW